MTQLLKVKDLILQFIGRYEIYVLAVVRFVVGFAAFRLIVLNTGYMDFLSDYPMAIILALVCCFLPSGVMVFVGAVLILLELYALSMYLCLIVALIFLIMFCAYMRFTVRKGMYVMLTPILSVMGVPYTMPVASGLFGEPYAVIATICGEVTYFMMRHVSESAVLFSVTDESEAGGVISLAVEQLLLDQEMYLYLIGFAAASVITFCLCKLRINQSHLIAAAVGIGSQIVIIGGGEIFLGNQAALIRILIGCIVSFLILLIVSFFTHNLDYSRVENVQFEDDDYYYYVRAIPKSFLPPKRGPYVHMDADGRLDRDRVSEAVEAELSERGKGAEDDLQDMVESGKQAGAVTTQLASDAVVQAAAAEEAERAAAEAVNERAAAAAQAISEAAGPKRPAEHVPETDTDTETDIDIDTDIESETDIPQ